jgi:glucosamine kinase
VTEKSAIKRREAARELKGKVAATTKRYFLGVDGGATRCRARLRAASGALVGDAEGPAANIYVDFDRALTAIRGTIAKALEGAGLTLAARSGISLGLGLAGLSSRQDAARVAAALPGWANIAAVNDAVAACLGAHGGADGGLIIAGTGTAAIARVKGGDTILGGRGFLLGDDGAAARIGADALRAALRAYDGLEPMTPLARALLSRFADDGVAMERWALTATPSDYGAFAPQALEAAAAGDSMARPIVEVAARALGALVRAVEKLGAPRISMIGGLTAPIRPFLEPEVAAKLSAPMYDPEDGAILAVGGGLPGLGAARQTA